MLQGCQVQEERNYVQGKKTVNMEVTRVRHSIEGGKAGRGGRIERLEGGGEKRWPTLYLESAGRNGEHTVRKQSERKKGLWVAMITARLSWYTGGQKCNKERPGKLWGEAEMGW